MEVRKVPKLTADMKQMIATQQCFIATVSPDGIPDVGPKGSTRVLDDETLMYIETTGRQTHTNVRNNGKVAIAVVNREMPDGYRFVGRATVHENGPIFEQAVRFTTENGRPAPKAAVTVAVEAIYTLRPGPTAGTQIA
ncbi:MAG TPA: pyridoxamine 5'-phosphate oxidase family protein [Symbiobacteriaceae bacterium]